MVPGLDGQHHVQAMAKLLLVEDLGLAIPAGAQMHTNRFGLVIVLKVHSVRIESVWNRWRFISTEYRP